MNRTALTLAAVFVSASAFAQTRTGRRHHGDASASPSPAPSSASPAPEAATASAAPVAEAVASSAPPAEVIASAAPVENPPVPVPIEPAPQPAPIIVEPAVKTVAVEFGPVLGLNGATNRLGLGPNVGLEVGVRIHAGPGFFGVHIRGAYERYSANGTGTLPCTRTPANGAPQSPCIETGGANSSSYTWALLEETVTLGLPLSYRLLDHSRFHPYIHVQPQLVLQRAQSTSFSLTTTETAMRFGLLGALGAQFDVGPGGIWLEAGYRWVPVNHITTGNATIGVIAVAIGYRFAF